MDCSCASILPFFLRSQMAPQQTAKFRAASFRHFRSTLRNDSVANYGSIWMPFPPSVRELDVLSFRSTVIRWCRKIRKFAAEVFQNAKNRPQICAKYFVWLLLRQLLTHVMSMGVTISCRYCITFDVMLFVSSLILGLFLSVLCGVFNRTNLLCLFSIFFLFYLLVIGQQAFQRKCLTGLGKIRLRNVSLFYLHMKKIRASKGLPNSFLILLRKVR